MILLGLCYSIGGALQAQDQRLLQEADALFSNKQYSQALEKYKSLHEQSQKVSPSMLLKMAYICEQQQNYVSALYYLHTYYHLSPDDKALAKIQEMAAEYKLEGYRQSDWEFLQVFLHRHHFLFSLLLIALYVLVLMVVIRRNQYRRRVPWYYTSLLMSLLILLITLNNLIPPPRKAIITQENACLMSAPSAGADLLQMLRRGYRVEVAGEQDIWLETRWNGKTAFVRKSQVLLID